MVTDAEDHQMALDEKEYIKGLQSISTQQTDCKTRIGLWMQALRHNAPHVRTRHPAG